MKKLVQCMAMAFLAIPAQAQLLNPDFEYWAASPQEPQTTNYAVGWVRNNWTVFGDTPLYFAAPTDAQSGNHAIKLCVWNHNEKDMVYQVASINYRPESLSGFYKYELNLIEDAVTGEVLEDIATVGIRLTKDNQTIGTGTLTLSASANYAPFNCTINYSSNEIPDYIWVTLDCSLLNTNWEDWTVSHVSPYEDGLSSLFTVDNLQLQSTMSNDAFQLSDVMVYPIPATDKISVANFEGSVVFYDATGRLVLQQEYKHGQEEINITQLQGGLYTVKLTNEMATKTVNVLIH
jgi:hypothetical protein